MKTILWISRHEMTGQQIADLERIAGEPIDLLCYKGTVYQIDSLIPMIERADMIAAVFPPMLLAKLVKLANGKPVLQAVSKRVPTGRYTVLPDGRKEQEFTFVHVCWQQVIKLEYEVKQM